MFKQKAAVNFFCKAYSTSLDTKINRLQSTNSYIDSLKHDWIDAKPYKTIPGPTKIQMFRSFFKGGDFHNLSFVEITKICRKRYGDLFAIPGFFGQKPNLITFNLDDYEKIFRTEGIHPIRPGFDAVTAYRASRKGELFDTLGTSAIGEEWAKYRHEVNPILMQPKSIQLFMEPLHAVNDSFVERIRKTRDSKSFEMSATFHNDIMRFGLESLGAVVFEKRLGLLANNINSPVLNDAEDLLNNLDTFFKSFNDLTIKPSLYKYIKTPTYRRFEESMATICNICYKLTKDSAQEGKHINSVKSSVLGELIKINPKLPPAVAVDSLLGGVEITTVALASLLLCIACNPQKQQQLRKEILNTIGKTEKFTIENMKNLPYLRACIKESMRLYPLLFSNLRVTNVDLSLSGYRVPKGSNILMASNMLLSEEKYFSQPNDFLPERWLRSNNMKMDNISARNVNPFIYLPFGFGPRTCMGKRLTEIIMEMTIANIVRNFDVQYNYPTENAFAYNFVLICNIPLKFKFRDIVN